MDINKEKEQKKLNFDLNQGIKGGKYSVLKVFHHPKKVKSFIEKKVVAPVYVRIKPTNACPHNCFYCVYNSKFSGIHPESNRKDMIPKQKIFEVLDDLKEMDVKAVTYSGGGEPLSYPWITDVLKKTLDFNISLSVITNGQLLNGKVAEILSQANWIRISLDYPDADTFSKIRGCPKEFFNQVKGNIKNFNKIKNAGCSLGINCVINEHNYNKVLAITEFCKELGVDNLRFAPLWKENFREYHKDIKDEAIRQINKAQELADQKIDIGSTYERYFNKTTGDNFRSYNKCYYMQIVPVIAADQNIYTCHNNAYEPKAKMGTIANKSFKEMWFSNEVDIFFKNFKHQEICTHECSNDEKNQILNEYLACADPHVVNFI